MQTTLESDSAPQKEDVLECLRGEPRSEMMVALQAIRGPIVQLMTAVLSRPIMGKAIGPGTEKGSKTAFGPYHAGMWREVNIALKENPFIPPTDPDQMNAEQQAGSGEKANDSPAGIWRQLSTALNDHASSEHPCIHPATEKLTTEKQVGAGDTKRSTVSAKEDDLLSTTDDINSAATHNAPERKPAEPPTDSSINDDKITTASADNNNADFPISEEVDDPVNDKDHLTGLFPYTDPNSEAFQSQTKLNETVEKSAAQTNDEKSVARNEKPIHVRTATTNRNGRSSALSMSLSSDTSEPSETDDDEPIMDKQKRRKERKGTEAKHEVRQTKGGASRSKRAPTQATETAPSTQKKAKYKKDSVHNQRATPMKEKRKEIPKIKK
jgi:hypothetical protein